MGLINDLIAVQCKMDTYGTGPVLAQHGIVKFRHEKLETITRYRQAQLCLFLKLQHLARHGRRFS